MIGECYKDAFHAIMEASELGAVDELFLVHGYPTCTAEGTERFGRRFGHAWLERDGIVFDAASGKLIPAVIYYAVGQIDPKQCQRYTWREAQKLALQQEHYGPWKKPPRDAMFGNQPRVKKHFARLRAERDEADRNPTFSVSYGISNAHLGVTFDVNSSKRDWIEQNYVSARCCYDDLVRYLRKLGFTLRPDKRTKRHYKTLSPTRRHGWLGHLQLEISCSGRCVEVEFFQEVVFDNPHGGRYDFNRESKMPYLVRKRYEWTKLRIHEFMGRAGIPLSPRKTPSPYPDPMAYFDDGWAMGYERMTGHKRFVRGENGWPSDREIQNFYAKNYEGDKICNADNDRVHYYRRRGRWLRCRVHGGINGQWLIILGGNDWTHDGAYTCSRLWRGRGRQFSDAEKLKALRRDLSKAVSSCQFRRAAAIQEYCQRAGIELTKDSKMEITIG